MAFILHEDGFWYSDETQNSSYGYLNKERQQVNALYIASYFRGKGWTDNAIAGMLGNMETESKIDPGLFQSFDYGDWTGSKQGFGLVQWTPSSKYKNWADGENRAPYYHMEHQCARIQYELEHNIQFTSTTKFPMTFAEFAASTYSAGYLAKVFVRNYEKPASIFGDNADAAYNQRAEQGEAWYTFIQEENPTPDPGGPDDPVIPGEPNQKKFDFTLWLCTRRKNIVVR